MAGTAMVVNGEGSRVKEGASNLLRDGSDVLAPVLADGGATYTPGLSERRSGNTTYMQGGDKSVEARTGSTGVVSGTRVYDAFGQTVGSTGTWAGPGGYGGRFGYREDGTALRLVGHRLYDPAAGRFLSRDPARDGRNWYAYCEGDPVGRADPEGLDYIWLAMNPGGFGQGSHLIIGVQGPNKDDTIHWHGYYPRNPGSGGGGGGSSTGGPNPNGPGYIKYPDKPKGENRASLEVSHEVALQLLSEIWDPSKPGAVIPGGRYKLRGHNCADWIVELLEGLGWEAPENLNKNMTTPNDVYKWFASDPRK